MWNQAKALLGDEFAGFTTYPVGLVFDPDQGHFQGLDEFMLTQSQLSRLFFGKCRGSFFQHFECWGSIFRVVAQTMGDYCFKFLIICPCLGQFFVDQGLEFLELLVGIANLFPYLFCNLFIGFAFLVVMVLFFRKNKVNIKL